ncbi:MAG: hypothetical protein SV775_10265 [Thermodesulfobacteriota bacterium]|nr:hypothetical protein [Thermodesulfobacteriota bacterium]
MKRAVISTLCSALVIPGLGQIVNRQLRKGACILSAVFVIIIAFVIEMYRVVITVVNSMDLNRSDPAMITNQIRANDPSVSLYVLTAFLALWLYSVLDAYFAGRKIDLLGNDNSHSETLEF